MHVCLSSPAPTDFNGAVLHKRVPCEAPGGVPVDVVFVLRLLGAHLGPACVHSTKSCSPKMHQVLFQGRDGGGQGML